MKNGKIKKSSKSPKVAKEIFAALRMPNLSNKKHFTVFVHRHRK